MSTRPRLRAASAALLVVLVASSGGCATKHLDEYNSVAMGNAAPAASPETGRPADGTVVDVGGAVLAVVSIGGPDLAVELDAPRRVAVGRVEGGRWAESTRVDLPAGAGTAVAGHGRAWVPVADGVVSVGRGGQERRLTGMGEVTSVAELDDGRLVTGTADGAVVVRGADGAESRRLTGLTRTDAIAVSGDRVVAVSRPDTTVATVDLGGEHTGPTLRVGKAAGTVVTATPGTFVVSDTTGGALAVYTSPPVRLDQYFPAGAAPWALAWDAGRALAWTATTGDNRLVAFDLGTGVGVRRAELPTVRQPDSVAVTEDGTVVVGSASGAGLHVLPPSSVHLR